MKMKLDILRWSIFGYFLLLGLAPTAVYASDCPPDDPSRGDCKSAASTARSPLVPIVGAVAGGMVGAIGSQILDRGPREDSEPKPKGPPCAADEARLREAESEVAMLTAIHAALQDMLETFNTQWENTRQAALWRAGVDLVFIAQSIVLPKLGEGAIKQHIKSEIMQKIVKESVSAISKEGAKDMIRIPYGEEIGMKSHKDEWWSGMFKILTSEITSRLNSRYGIFGVDPGGNVLPNLPPTLLDGTGNPLVKNMSEGMGNIVGGLWDYWDLYDNASKDAAAMKAIRDKLLTVLKDKLEAESALQDAIDELESSRRVLEHCRKIWGLTANAQP